MTHTYELLPAAWSRAMPTGLGSNLLDMGVSCNEAALALNCALMERRRSVHVCEVMEAAGTRGERLRFGRTWCDATLSYTDQLTALYTCVAATYASYSATVAVAVIAGRPAPDEPEPVRPSLLLLEPQRYLPLVRLAEPSADPATLDHNDSVARQHEELTKAVTDTVRHLPLDAYDDPGALAAWSSRAINVDVRLARSLHGYGAVCAWAIGLVSRTD